MSTEELRPVILIGAARSGTKVLRDAISEASGVPAVPYDVTYVWRYGNDADPHDRQLPGDVTGPTRKMVRGFLSRYADDQGRVIEKTVGNTLRVAYVAEIVPGARFIHLIRDGVEVAESTRRQWQAPTDLGYLKDKIRHFPPRLLASYGRRFVMWTVRRKLSKSEAVASWGPRYVGIDDDVSSDELLAVCARQWRESVTLAARDFEEMSIDCLEIRYEDLVAEPAAVLAQILDYAQLPANETALERAAGTIQAGHGGAVDRLSDSERGVLDREIGPLLEGLGYSRPGSIAGKDEGR